MTEAIILKALTTTRALVWVDPRGRAEFVRCDWIVRRPNGNPEPDFPEDCYDEVPCGALVRALTADPEVGWKCDAGHERWPYGSPQWAAHEAQAEARERMLECFA